MDDHRALIEAGRLTRFGAENGPAICGATCKRTGQPCRAPAMKAKRRCQMHGGKSTGPRTAEGKDRIRRAAWKHGRYSIFTKEARRRQRESPT